MSGQSFLKRGAFVGCGVFFIALLVRLFGIQWGLPSELHHQSYHPDEPYIWAVSQQIEPARGKFDPGFYNYGTLYLTLLRVASDAVAVYGGRPGSDRDTDWKYVRACHLAGRWISSLAGAATALLVFLLFWKKGYLFAGGAAGVAMALAPGHVVHSRFQTVDILATFLLVVGLYVVSLLLPVDQLQQDSDIQQPTTVLEDRSILRSVLLGGFFIGLSAGTKYTGILALLGLWVILFQSPNLRKAKWLLVSGASCLVGFFIATPGALLNTQKFWQDFRYEMAHTSSGHGLVFADTASGFLYHLANLVAGFGGLPLLVGVVGLVLICMKPTSRTAWVFGFVLFAVVYYVLIGRAEVKFFRYTLPLFPVLAIGFGWFAHLVQKMRSEGRISQAFFGGALLAVCLAHWLSSALQYTSWMVGMDPRDQAAKYVQSKGDVSVGVVSDPWFYTPPFYAETALPRSVPFPIRDGLRGEAKNPRVKQYVPDKGQEKIDWDVRLLEFEPPDYVIYSSFEFDDLDRLKRKGTDQEPYRSLVQRTSGFLEKLAADYQLEKLYGSDYPSIHDLMYVRPKIWVWKRKTPSEKKSTSSSNISSSSEGPASTR